MSSQLPAPQPGRPATDTPTEDDVELPPEPRGLLRTLSRWYHRHPTIIDISIAAGVGTYSLVVAIPLLLRPSSPARTYPILPLALIVIALMGVALSLRRRFPLWCWAAILLIPETYQFAVLHAFHLTTEQLLYAAIGVSGMELISVPFALGAIASHRRPAAAWTAGCISLVVLMVDLSLTTPGLSIGELLRTTVILVLLILVGILLGFNARSARLRLKAVEGVLDEAYASMRELGAVAQRTEARTVERLVSDPMTGGIGASRPGITFGVYGPEYDKYGGVAGVEEAERHFYVSSRWCLDHQVWQIPRPVPRAALAARFLALAARSAPLPEAELLSAHLRMWGSRLPAHLRDGSALGPIVQQLLEVIEFQFDEIPSWSQAAAAVGELADDAGRAIGVMGAGTGGRRALDLLHIDVNRLGLNPAEECIAGLCARQLLTGGAVPPAQPSAAVG